MIVEVRILDDFCYFVIKTYLMGTHWSHIAKTCCGYSLEGPRIDAWRGMSYKY